MEPPPVVCRLRRPAEASAARSGEHEALALRELLAEAAEVAAIRAPFCCCGWAPVPDVAEAAAAAAPGPGLGVPVL